MSLTRRAADSLIAGSEVWLVGGTYGNVSLSLPRVIVRLSEPFSISWGEELDELRRRRGPPKRPGKIKLDGLNVPSAKVGAEFARAFNVRLVEQTTASWEFYFGLLQRFVEREGDARIPTDHNEDGYRLGLWLNNQRARRDRLDPGRQAQLEDLRGWTWDAKDAAWDEGFVHLQRFVEREGHARTPSSYKDDDGFKLGGWVRHQREFRRRGKLPDERVRRLESLHGWAWDPHDAAWEEGFEHLQSYVMREGHARIPQNWREGDFVLGSWVLRQRQRYRRGTLEPERRARLEALSEWTWHPHEAAWEEGFAHLERFVQREGHARVAKTWCEGDYRLGAWVDQQRILFRNGKLDPKRRARLEALPDWAWTLYGTSTPPRKAAARR